MLKLAYFSVLTFIVLELQGSLANSRRSVCLLQDLSNQCGDFCLSKLHPMMDLIPETNFQLKGIFELLKVQTAVDVQRITMQNSLKNMSTKVDFFELKRRIQLLSTKTETKQNVLLESLSNIVTKDEVKSQLQELHKLTEEQLLAMQAKMESLQLALREILARIHAKSIPPEFQLIGSRYFYIDYDILSSWHEAAATCRRMGGYLAAFESQEELDAVIAKFKAVWGHFFWTGLNDLSEDDQFTSMASGKPAKVLKWKQGSPNLGNACVVLNDDYMIDKECSNRYHFICQHDDDA